MKRWILVACLVLVSALGFLAPAGVRANFDFSQAGGPDQVTPYFYEPQSSSEYTVCNIDSNTTCSVQTPVGGTWSITLIPDKANVGSLTIKLT